MDIKYNWQQKFSKCYLRSVNVPVGFCPYSHLFCGIKHTESSPWWSASTGKVSVVPEGFTQDFYINIKTPDDILHEPSKSPPLLLHLKPPLSISHVFFSQRKEKRVLSLLFHQKVCIWFCQRKLSLLKQYFMFCNIVLHAKVLIKKIV